VLKLLKSLCHSEQSDESELKTRLFAMLRVAIETFHTVLELGSEKYCGNLARQLVKQ